MITEKEIKNILKQDYNYAKTLYSQDRILGAFVFGKASYGLAETVEDIQVKIYYLSTLFKVLKHLMQIFTFLISPSTLRDLSTKFALKVLFVLTPILEPVPPFFLHKPFLGTLYPTLVPFPHTSQHLPIVTCPPLYVNR